MPRIYFVFALNLLNGSKVQAARVVLALFALELGAGPVTIGVLAATFSLLPMLLSVSAGKLADRFGSRWLLTFGMAAGGVGMLLPWFISGLPVIFTAAVLVGLSTSVCNVSLQSLAGLLSSPQDRARNFSNYSLMGSITNFAGPLIAGFSVDHFGHGTACLMLALFALVPITLLLVRGGILPRGASRSKHQSSGSILDTIMLPGVRRVLAAGSLLNAGESLYLYYMPVYMHAIDLSASAIGMVLAMNSAAAFVVRLVLPRLITRYGEEKVLAYAFYLGGASLALVPFIESALLLALISFAFGLGMGCCSPIVTMLVFGSSPEGRAGETMGLKITVNHFTKVVSPVVFGLVATAFGLPPIFWMDALMLAGGGLLSRARRNSPGAPSDRAQARK